MGTDGKVRPRVFWLGKDQNQAISTARILAEYWHSMNDGGHAHWTPELERKAQACIATQQSLDRAISDQLRALLVNGSTSHAAPPSDTASTTLCADNNRGTVTVAKIVEGYLKFAEVYYQSTSDKGEPKQYKMASTVACSARKYACRSIRTASAVRGARRDDTKRMVAQIPKPANREDHSGLQVGGLPGAGTRERVGIAP
jgi:hypothetical protein